MGVILIGSRARGWKTIASFVIAAVPWYKNSEKQRRNDPASEKKQDARSAIQDFCGRGHSKKTANPPLVQL
jgi:hypothetical protein